MRYLAVLATFALTLLPIPAAAQEAPIYPVRCAVSDTSPFVQVLIGVGTLDNQDAIDGAASVCSNWISTNQWQGAPNDVQPVGYNPIGTATLNDTTVVTLWATPDASSMLSAWGLLLAMQDSGFGVTYY